MSSKLMEPVNTVAPADQPAGVKPAPPRRPRRGLIFGIAGVLLIAAAVIFRVAIVPSLLKLPTNLDKTAHFAGQELAYLDPGTGTPLSRPNQLPLTITRHVTADPKASNGERIVLDEAVTADVKGAPPLLQHNRYVMNRKSAVNVSDPRAYAFTPANKVDRSGAYRLAFGFGVPEGKPIELYSNDTNSTYQATPDARTPSGNVEGNRALNYEMHQPPHALSPVYLAGLEHAIGLPASTTLNQLSRGLRRAGVDLPAVVASLPTADQTRIAALQRKPIPLLYEESLSGRIAIEPETGLLANLFDERITVTVRPNPNGIAPLAAILKRNDGVAAVRSALPKIQAASSDAQPVFALDYHQTSASVSKTADDISSATTQLSIAKLWLPLLLAALGIGFVALGARRALRAR